VVRVLHPEPTIEDGPKVKLTYLPFYILVKLTRTRAMKLEGLDEAIIPVEPTYVKFQIKTKLLENKHGVP
jgi:hypothetical protein